MGNDASKGRCQARFAEYFGKPAEITASAPGRLEVLGNHTDYNLGLTLSCAVGLRCYASLAGSATPEVTLASTAFDMQAETYPLANPVASKGHWANFALGLVATLQERGHEVPGFALLIDSQVPGSAGLSSSSALEMAVLSALVAHMQLGLEPIELAKIGQHAESVIVGAKTGLLDPLSSLLGKAEHLLEIDFETLAFQQHAMPEGWCFVAIDSGVKHDLTQEYNDRRALCEEAAAAMGLSSLRDADHDLLDQSRAAMPEASWRCARHIVSENMRVRQAQAALRQSDVQGLGRLMFESHASSRDDFLNSCAELDELVGYAQQDERCVGARLSGGGFGGITIHLVRQTDADSYLNDLTSWSQANGRPKPWGAVCRIDDGARLEG